VAALLVAVPFGIAIGLAVGMVGGGGAVLAVPVLIYIVGLDVHEATTVSLAVVAAAAATGAAGQMRRGAVCWSSAAWFAGAAAVGSLVGAVGNQCFGGAALLFVFAGVMLVAARATWQRAGQPAAGVAGCPKARAKVLVPVGLGVGVVTGLVGVGGGFLVVPALAVGLSFGMREAMGTSMVIVGIVSLCGLAAHLAVGSAMDWPVALVMGSATVAGAMAGPRIADHVPLKTLGRGFAALVAAVAVGVAVATAAGVAV
jgi:uncharacterized membrane protein YfcA